jgi:hypothetical protein
MPVALRHSETLNLTFVECSGLVSTDQLGGLAACAAETPVLLSSDSLNVIRPDADLSGVDLCALGAMYARYQELYAPLKFQVYRRTAWVCQSPSADAHVDFWVKGANPGKAFSTNVRRVETLAEAGDWLLLSSAELAQIETGEGFVQLAVFDEPRARRALAR